VQAIRRTSKRLYYVLSAGMLVVEAVCGIQARGQTPAGPQDLKAPVFQEFSDRVQKYLQLHKSVEGTLPKLKSTSDPEMIEAHQNALARKIRAARAQAKQGDIFTPAASEEFKKALSTAFQSPRAPNARATIKQGASLKEVHLRVNQTYPKAVPNTSVPPTLLQNLPKLPDEIAYRVVSHDLVLLDVRANLVLDFIPGVIPAQPPSE
jgi:hypothetical protein